MEDEDRGFRGHGIQKKRKRPREEQSAGLTYPEKQKWILGLLAAAGDSNTAGRSMLPPEKRNRTQKSNVEAKWPWEELSKEDLENLKVETKNNKTGLKAMCKQLGLLQKEKNQKAQLIQRLLEYQALAKAAAPPTVSLPEAGEAGDGAVQGEADASVPAVQAEAPAPAAPQPPPGQKQDLESEMTGHQGLPTAQAIPNFDSMMNYVLSYGSLLGPI